MRGRAADAGCCPAHQIRCSLHHLLHLQTGKQRQLVMHVTVGADVVIQRMSRIMTVSCACRRRHSLCCSAGVRREVQLRCVTS